LKSHSIHYFLIIIIALASKDVVAQSKYSNEFLNLGIGAKGLSLANTGVSMVNDVTASYWNPAGLANVEKKYELSLMHAAYFAGIANMIIWESPTVLMKSKA
jgi:hypothetical protein